MSCPVSMRVNIIKLNDAQRRKTGLPKVDTHVYARENGWMKFIRSRKCMRATSIESYLG